MDDPINSNFEATILLISHKDHPLDCARMQVRGVVPRPRRELRRARRGEETGGEETENMRERLH